MTCVRICPVCAQPTIRPDVCDPCSIHIGDQDLQDHESQGEDT